MESSLLLAFGTAQSRFHIPLSPRLRQPLAIILRINLFHSQGPGPNRHEITWQVPMANTFHVPERFDCWNSPRKINAETRASEHTHSVSPHAVAYLCSTARM